MSVRLSVCHTVGSVQDSLADAKVSARQQCVYEDPQRTWCAMLYRGISMVGIPWYTMVHHGIPWFTMVNHGISYHGKPWYDHVVLWFTIVNHGIPWCCHGIPWFDIPWFTMVLIYMVYYGIPWYTMVY